MKRSLFNRPAWAQPTSITDSTNLFHRSDQTYAKVAAEEECRRKQRLAQKEQKGKKAPTTEISSEAPRSKRRRLSVESDGDSENSDDSIRSNPKVFANGKSALSEGNEEEPSHQSATLPKESSPKSLAKRYDNAITENLSRMCETTIKAVKNKSTQQARSNNIIDLDDSEDESKYEPALRRQSPSTKVTKTKATASLTDDFLASDDEFEELARAAREKARRKGLQEVILQSPPVLSPNAGDAISTFQSPSTHEPTSPPPQVLAANDPVIQILITSELPNTNPLIVNRRTSQRLKDVRITWCNRQKFTSQMSSSVFLTWRGKRLFDVTTCKSLGIAADEDGNIRFEGSENLFGEDERRIHMEVMNKELFAEYKMKKQRKDQGEEEQKSKEETEEAVKAKKDNSEPQVRVVIKARDFADFKLIVRPSTLISRIVNAFRNANNLGLDRDVFLQFDGERLEPESQVSEAEISDMDYIDAYVK